MATPAIGVQAKSRLDELYRAHAPAIYRYAYAVLGNRADAEDVMQTTFVNALRALERGEVPRKPANWLITITHNLIRQRFRQQYIRPRQVELEGDIAMLEADDDAPSIEDLVRALQRIPEAQREALVLRELEGRSYKEIAAILDVSRPALEGLIFRARRSLAEELENLVTCDSAELALSQIADGRVGRKERRRLVAHLEECSSCARIAAVAMKRRHAFKGLALLPLPWSLTFFKGAPTASAAVGLPTIGGAAAGGTAAGVVGGGVVAKVAIGLATVAIAGGAGYEGVQAVRGPVPAAQAASVAAGTPSTDAPDSRTPAVVAKARPRPAATERVKAPERGRSATAPGHTKIVAKPKSKSKAKPKPAAAAKPKGASTSSAAKPTPKVSHAKRTPPPKAEKPVKAEKTKPRQEPDKKEPVALARPALPANPHDVKILPDAVRTPKVPRP